MMSRILDDIYSSLPSGSDADEQDRLAVDAVCGDGAATYGEIHPEAASRLLHWLKLEQGDCFVDCGSGTGRLVLQAALETGVGRAVGIEMSAFRHGVACDAKRKADCAGAPSQRIGCVSFHFGDFRDLLPAETTVVYAGSLCFPPALMSSLAEKVCGARRFRALCTLKPLPDGWKSQIREIGEIDLEMTWSKNNRLYIYGPKRL